MRVYVFGGARDELIELANQLNESGATALIGKEGDGMSDVSSKIGRNFDCAVMVSEDPIKDSIQANRDSKLRAAPCYDQRSLTASAKEDINLFIIDQPAAQRLDLSIIARGSSNQAAPDRETSRDRPVINKGIFKSVGSAAASKPQKEQPEKPQKKAKEQKRPELEDEEDEGPAHKRSGDGLKGRIRDIFGIEE
jgi:hypothetical protein